MKKINALWILLVTLVFGLFNILFFMTSMSESTRAAVWVTYAFICVAYLVFVATPILTGRYDKKTKIFGAEPVAVGGVYFCIELFLGILFILIKASDVKATIILQVILLVLYVIALLVSLIISEKRNSGPLPLEEIEDREKEQLEEKKKKKK